MEEQRRVYGVDSQKAETTFGSYYLMRSVEAKKTPKGR